MHKNIVTENLAHLFEFHASTILALQNVSVNFVAQVKKIYVYINYFIIVSVASAGTIGQLQKHVAALQTGSSHSH